MYLCQKKIDFSALFGSCNICPRAGNRVQDDPYVAVRHIAYEVLVLLS